MNSRASTADTPATGAADAEVATAAPAVAVALTAEEGSIGAPDAGTPVVRSGQVLALRLVDVAYAIDRKRAEALWSGRRRHPGARAQLSTTPAKAMSFDVPPLALQLDGADLGTSLGQAEASVRLYDFGVAAFMLRLPVAELGWDDFTALTDRVDRTADRMPRPRSGPRC